MVFIREFPIPTEATVRLQKTNVEAQVSVSAGVLGKGTLYIAEDAISWISGESSDVGFRILYPDMVLHAVSRDRDLCASDCIYIMVNGNFEGGEGDAGVDAQEEDKEEMMTEIRFIPEDPATLQDFYNTISDCNLLHDPPESNSSDELDPDILPAGVPVENDNMDEVDSDEERLAMFQRMNLHFGMSSNGNGNGTSSNEEQFDPDQFEDAD